MLRQKNAKDGQRGQAERRKEQAGASRNLGANLQRKDRSGEQKEHGYPKQENGAELVAEGQQGCWLVHSAADHQRNEEGGDKRGRTEILDDITRRAVSLNMIDHSSERARRKNDSNISRNGNELDRIVTDGPFLRRNRLLRQFANNSTINYVYVTLYKIHLVGPREGDRLRFI